MKSLSGYSKVKIVVYAIGLVLTFYSYSQFGLEATHTPPLAFIISICFFLLSMAWLVSDLVIKELFRLENMDFKINYIGFVINLLIIGYIVYLRS